MPRYPEWAWPLFRGPDVVGSDTKMSGEFRASNFAHHGRVVAAHHQLVAGPGQPDVDAFPQPHLVGPGVDGEDHGATLESFEAEDVAIEHLLGVPERVPISTRPQGLALDLFGVAAAGGQQGNVLGAPPIAEEVFEPASHAR